MNLKHLSDVHTGRYAERVKNDVKRTTIRKERHILYRKYTGNNTLVTVTAGHLITYGDLTFLSDVDSYGLVYARSKLIAVLSCEYLSVNDGAICAMRYFQRCVTNFSCLLTKDCTEKSLFCCQLSFTLRCYFTNQDVTGTNLSTDTDDSALVKVLQCIFTNARNISCDLFRS